MTSDSTQVARVRFLGPLRRHSGGSQLRREGPLLGERLTAATVVGTALMLVAIAGLAAAESRPDAKS
ncbi:hypothetical protein ACIBCA_20685 [Kitasatospora sp. NPDC051170]|uniref:hypothetical protein n=1 Tax=Kitasatospora sp. NPDC051170 TaxID=3364056 RepID=UPI0037947084